MTTRFFRQEDKFFISAKTHLSQLGGENDWSRSIFEEHLADLRLRRRRRRQPDSGKLGQRDDVLKSGWYGVWTKKNSAE